MSDSINKSKYIIDKAKDITYALGNPNDDESGYSLTIGSLTIDCINVEEGISVYIYSDGVLALNASKILGEVTCIHGKWMDVVNYVYHILPELVIIKDIRRIIIEMNELSDYYFWYTQTHPMYRHLLDERLANVGIKITERKVQSGIISTEGEYPIYNQHNEYSIIVDNKVVGVFRDGQYNLIDYILQFKSGEWVKLFKEAINDYLNLEEFSKKNKLKTK